ncbi:cGMP-dependent protein kinase, isozyme 1-like [Stegodyphus dumicola]|nr:cGMP-dependent protein kinase, isozyme 1-like [Stegodyphus dumicola]
MAEAQTDDELQSSQPDDDVRARSGQKSKPHSPLRRGFSRMSKWVQVARRALVNSREGSMGHGSSLSSIKRQEAQEQVDDEDDIEVDREDTNLQQEVENLKRLVQEKDQIISDLRREVEQMKDVLKSTSAVGGGCCAPDILSCIMDSKEKVTSKRYGRHIPLTKKQGVSGESAGCQDFDDFQVQKHEKDFRSKQLIKEAIMDNDFLKNLDSSQVREIVDCMYCQYFTKGTLVIREGDVGSHLYVSAEGELQVLKDDKVIGILRPGRAFGELAILYNCTRTATVKAAEDAKIWVMDRKAFHTIMMKTGLQRQEDNMKFLRSVPLLKNLKDEVLAKMADVLEVDFFPSGEYIIREGVTGDTFFIISKGNVIVTRKKLDVEEEIRSLGKGDYFGERALLNFLQEVFFNGIIPKAGNHEFLSSIGPIPETG